MLGKLIKNEFKNTYKLMCTIYLVLAASTLFGGLVLAIEPLQKGKLGDVMMPTFVLAYVLSIVALFIVTFLYMCQRFYKTMYSDQGYLTHTLPVKPSANLNAKLLVSAIWMILSGVLMLFSVMVLILAYAKEEFFEALGQINYHELDQFCVSMFGYSLLQCMGILLLMVVITALVSLLLVYVSLSIGQLFSAHKIGASVGAGVIIYFIEQIISAILMVGFAARSYNTISSTEVYSSSEEVISVITSVTSPELLAQGHRMLWTYMGEYALFALVAYLGCYFIIKKHVNLD